MNPRPRRPRPARGSAARGPARPALVCVGLLPVMGAADHRAERVTDAPLGTPLRCRGPADAEWQAVELPDGYRGFARSLGLAPCSAARARRFARAPRLVSPSGELRAAAGGPVVLRLPLGARLPVLGRVRGGVRVELPAGGSGVLRGTLAARPRRSRPAALVRHARGCLGVPYLWGGRSGWGLDCSGLVQLAGDLAGLDLPRDARDQWRCGRAVGAHRAEVLRAGDLLFFGRSASAITHVVIYLGSGNYIHSLGSVQIHSLRPGDPRYLDSLPAFFRGARRLIFA
ncbi:MAG TPA: C40 family peptidase [Candidatus Saccharimonadales bacterium]|nr:C40 family peptidase [Candidatus Saccharimonadales bacterium]